MDHEPNVQFEGRKADHIRLSLSDKNQAVGESGLEQIQLIHEALPDLDFKDIRLDARVLGRNLSTPFFISSMTAGHSESQSLNLTLARASEARGWCMGVGSQRKELGDAEAAREWREIRKVVPKAILYGNIGLAQLIRSKTSDIEKLVDSLKASAMFVHLNALQECLQPEGTPNFKGGLKAIERLCKQLSVPVIVKETGCGFSKATLKRLRGTGVKALDVSGLGGTHWGRIEGARAGDERHAAAATLANWGISTVDSVLGAIGIKHDYEVWASGGVRSGLDAAKLLAMGANAIGFAKPILAAALKGEDELLRQMATFEFELKTVLFCTGCKTPAELHSKKVWKWRAK
ncbi:MAG: type 2 isopentenyl-diphosphate Delta-isomerase [Bdellovibrionales bacterium]|nr:type 2 isopentenyl-diphosphate Delta-isomerase [Bdellovibrionales bacterium]